MNIIKKVIRFFIPECVILRIRVLRVRILQWMVLSRIRRKVRRGDKINVLFLSSENAKWKCQSLYNLMHESRWFNPIVGIMRQDVDIKDDKVNIKRNIDCAEAFYKANGCDTVIVYDPDKLEYKSLRIFSLDLVFYQQPWNVIGDVVPEKVSNYALPCYIPYYVPNYLFPELAYKQLFFHPYLAWHFVLNEFERSLGQSMRKLWNFAGTLVTSGHPMLDEFYLNSIEVPRKPCVIYAPHFTFSHPNNKCIVHYSTFLDYGDYILEYSKKHPELNWVFKPHPVLRTALIKSGVWTEKQVDDYYAEWKKLGRIHESGDYLSLFREATTMITDCGSFLTEFAVTGQPIIHLINPDNKLEPLPLYLTYYRVCSMDDLKNQLCEILEKKNDAKRNERLQAVSDANLCDQYAAKNIVNFLKNKLYIKDNV